jgi:hypothetical protein
VQIYDDGTHVILLVATPLAGRLDHAAVPVMWLRQTDGKMRRDGCQLPCRGDFRPSMSAQECTAHRVLARGRRFVVSMQSLVTAERGSQNG